MMSEVVLEENRASTVHLSDDQVSALEEIGRRMASRLEWWGAHCRAESAGADTEATSVVSIAFRSNGAHLVKFRNVVGAVRLGDTQLKVVPKIPLNHFCYLMQKSDVSPRVGDHAIRVGSSEDLRELVCRWLLVEAEWLLRLGLHRDYSEYDEELSEVRGTVQAIPTVLANLAGRAAVRCVYSDLDEDAAINRLIKAGCVEVALNPLLDDSQRLRARRLVLAMGAVGPLRHSDGRFQATRLHSRYSRAIPLAKLVLAGRGTCLDHGGVSGTAFLLPTPGVIESGLRNVLSEALPTIDVKKRGLRLAEGRITLNPDLVIDGGHTVGDVKYKYFGGDWDRASFNQVVTFATGFQAERAFIVGFRRKEDGSIPAPAKVGQVRVRKFAWVASDDVSPESSERRLKEEVSEWLG